MDAKKEQELLEEVPCLCGSVKTTEVLSIPPFKYVKCKECSLVYLSPRLKTSALRDFYSDDESAAGLNSADKEKALYYQRFTEELLEINKLKKAGKLLDIGSNFGFFLDVARSKGFVPYGVEPSKPKSEYSRQKLGLDVFTGFLKNANFPKSFFDVVTCWHVVEHMPYPADEFLEIKRILKPDGLLVIDVPIAKEMDVHLTESEKRSINLKHPPDHIYYFSQKTLTEALDRAGMKVIKVIPHGGTGILTRLSGHKDGPNKTGLLKRLARISWLHKLAVKMFGRKDEITVYAVPKNLEPVMNLAPAFPTE